MPEEIDQHTEHILKALVAALDTAGTKSSSKGHNAPWWTEKCQQALIRLRRAKRNIGSEELWKNCEERREFLGTVRREKLEYWRRVIDAVDSDQDLYKVVNWHKLRPNIKAPALNINGKIIWENTAKADALRKTLLERVTDDEDLTDDPRRCKGPAKTSAPDIVSSKHNYTIKPTDKPAVQWLGIWFDRRLKFSHHIQERVGKANKLVQHLRNLSNTKRGPPANLLRKAIITCVIPVLLYGAEAWYEGPTKAPQHIAHARLGNVATMQAEGINKIDETIRNAIRAILPVWKTTPNNTLYRDTGVPTARVALEDARHRFGLRIQAVHKDHPLAARAQREMWKKRFHNRRPAGALKPPQTRLQRASMLPETFPRPRQALGKRLTAAVSVTNNRNKKEAAKEFQQWQKDLPDTHLVAFSDGSQDERGAVGWGYAIYRDGRKIAQGKGRLGIAEVFDGEAEGARNALKRACQIDAGAQIHICIDNTSVIAGLLGDAPTSSQDAFLEFQEIAQAVAVNVRWAPGHEDIEGNAGVDCIRPTVHGTGGKYGNALQAASYNGNREVVQPLLDKGADVNTQGGKYGNALQAASSKGNRDVVQLLLNKGADVNAWGGQYGNALQAASYNGNREVIQLLLDKGADVNARGGWHGNALQAALNEGHQEVVFPASRRAWGVQETI
ncbi:Ankyrin repeat [Fusarium oxysporum f. sp. vasinfectum]|nr:Ankyrin repeat [Fusarium oxysporum f. sp. vasinfectum]